MISTLPTTVTHLALPDSFSITFATMLAGDRVCPALDAHSHQLGAACVLLERRQADRAILGIASLFRLGSRTILRPVFAG